MRKGRLSKSLLQVASRRAQGCPLRQIYRRRAAVLGVTCNHVSVKADCALGAEPRARLGKMVTAAADQDDNCREVAIQVLVRTQDFGFCAPSVMSGSLIKIGLTEIYYHFSEPLAELEVEDSESEASGLLSTFFWLAFIIRNAFVSSSSSREAFAARSLFSTPRNP